MAGANTVALLEKDVCDDLLTARFERPADYEFAAGQWFRLTLDTPAGPETRTLSHASAPADPYLDMATRVSPSGFKQALLALEPGQTAQLSGPGGRLRLGAHEERLAFLVGGVGITPVRGLLRDAVQRGVTFDDAVLLYGNRSVSCVAYLDEMLAMAEHGVRTVLVYETPEPDWPGEVGFITEDVVRRAIDDVDERRFIVAGPPVMVTVMQTLLESMGIGPERTTIEAFGSRG